MPLDAVNEREAVSLEDVLTQIEALYGPTPEEKAISEDVLDEMAKMPLLPQDDSPATQDELDAYRQAAEDDGEDCDESDDEIAAIVRDRERRRRIAGMKRAREARRRVMERRRWRKTPVVGPLLRVSRPDRSRRVAARPRERHAPSRRRTAASRGDPHLPDSDEPADIGEVVA